MTTRAVRATVRREWSDRCPAVEVVPDVAASAPGSFLAAAAAAAAASAADPSAAVVGVALEGSPGELPCWAAATSVYPSAPGMPRPGVGSKGTQPTSGKYTSGQVWYSSAVTVHVPSVCLP